MIIAFTNVLYFPDERGGAEKSVRILAESCVAAGHSAVVITLGRERRTESINGVIVERLPIRNVYLPALEQEPSAVKRLIWHMLDAWNPKAARDIAEILAKHSPDVVHTNSIAGFSVSAWQVARRLGIRVVHTIRDFYLMCPKCTRMRGTSACRRRCVKCRVLSIPKRAVCDSVSHVVGISRFMLDAHREGGYFAGVPGSVIHNSYLPPAPAAGAVRSPLHTTLGFMGRLFPTKGIELLLDSLRDLSPSYPGLRLLIAGDGPQAYVEHLRALARGLPVEFVGRSAPEAFFPRLDLAVVPSVWDEPLGRVVIEAMAFGVPVVATPVGGIPELLAQGGGVLALETDAPSLTAALRTALERIRDTPGQLEEEASSQAKARFEPSHIAESYLRVLQPDSAIAT